MRVCRLFQHRCSFHSTLAKLVLLDALPGLCLHGCCALQLIETAKGPSIDVVEYCFTGAPSPGAGQIALIARCPNVILIIDCLAKLPMLNKRALMAAGSRAEDASGLTSQLYFAYAHACEDVTYCKGVMCQCPFTACPVIHLPIVLHVAACQAD